MHTGPGASGIAGFRQHAPALYNTAQTVRAGAHAPPQSRPLNTPGALRHDEIPAFRGLRLRASCVVPGRGRPDGPARPHRRGLARAPRSGRAVRQSGRSPHERRIQGGGLPGRGTGRPASVGGTDHAGRLGHVDRLAREHGDVREGTERHDGALPLLGLRPGPQGDRRVRDGLDERQARSQRRRRALDVRLRLPPDDDQRDRGELRRRPQRRQDPRAALDRAPCGVRRDRRQHAADCVQRALHFLEAGRRRRGREPRLHDPRGFALRNAGPARAHEPLLRLSGVPREQDVHGRPP